MADAKVEAEIGACTAEAFSKLLDEREARSPKQTSRKTEWIPPEWLKWLAPILLGFIAYNYNNLKTGIEETRSDQQRLEARLPLDYVPRAEHQRNAIADAKTADDQNQRMTRLETKMDQIILDLATLQQYYSRPQSMVVPPRGER